MSTEHTEKALQMYSRSRYLFWAFVAALIILFGYVTLSTLIGVQTTSDRLLSCTDPKGTCYQSGDRRNGAAIKAINDAQRTIVVAAAFCSKQPQNVTLNQIEACVNNTLGNGASK